jgi:hypothetical protein
LPINNRIKKTAITGGFLESLVLNSAYERLPLFTALGLE